MLFSCQKQRRKKLSTTKNKTEIKNISIKKHNNILRKLFIKNNEVTDTIRDSYDNALRNRDSTIEGLRTKIKVLEQDNKNLDEMISVRDRMIFDLQDKSNAQAFVITNLGKQLSMNEQSRIGRYARFYKNPNNTMQATATPKFSDPKFQIDTNVDKETIYKFFR